MTNLVLITTQDMRLRRVCNRTIGKPYRFDPEDSAAQRLLELEYFRRHGVRVAGAPGEPGAQAFARLASQLAT